MGNITPNISIYTPSAGETNYDQPFLAGMMNVDQHDHSGGPTKGVPISGSGIADGSITYQKLSTNVTDPTTGIGQSVVNPNQIIALGLLDSLYNVPGNGFLTNNGTSASTRTLIGTALQIAITNPAGIAGNPVFSLAPIVTLSTQPAFLANAGAQNLVTGDGTVYTALFAAGGGNTFDQGGNFSSPTFTVPADGTGIYVIHAELSLSGIDATAHIQGEIGIAIGGTPIYTNFNGSVSAVRNSGGGFIMSVDQVAKLTAADAVTITLQVSGGAKTINILDGTFSAVKVW